MNYWLFLIPFICAFLGWLANSIAIKMLFHPRKPKKIFGFTFQGLFPKRQNKFAEKLGKLISNEFRSFNIEQTINDPQNLKKMMPLIETHVDDFLKVRLAKQIPAVGMFIGEKTIGSLKKVFMQEIEMLFPQVIKQFAANLKDELNLEQIVIKRLANFPTDKVEKMLFHNMGEQFRLVKITGAAIGFIIGVFQVVITLLTSN